MNKRVLVVAPLLVALANACSLDQRAGDSGMARIQLNTLTRAGAPARLATIPGTAAPTASSYYILDVEGEGIPRSVLEPSNCFKTSPVSSAMVPALLNSGEAQNTEVELKVPIGANRKVRIFRVDLSFPPGSASPFFGENPFAFRVRNPQYGFIGEKFLLADAEIPLLNGDQSVNLVEKAIAQPLGNQCSNVGPPPISNGEVQLSEYEPFGNQFLWSGPYVFRLRGRITRLQSGMTSYYVSSPSLATPGGTVTVEGSPPPGVAVGGPSPAPSQAWLSRVFTFTPPVALPVSQVVTGTIPYSGGSLPSIAWSFPMTVRSEVAPLSVSSPITGTPLVVGGMTYANTFKVGILANRAVELQGIQPGSDVFGYYAGLSSEPSLELVPPPPSATGTPCPLNVPGSPVGPLSLGAAALCDVYVRTYQQTGSANYVLNLKSVSGGNFGAQTAILTQGGGLSLSLNHQGEMFLDGIQTSSSTLTFDGSTILPAATPSMSGSWALPVGGAGTTLAIEQVSLRSANGNQCAQIGIPFCGVTITAGSPSSLTFPSNLGGSPLVELSVVVKKIISFSNTTYYRQTVRLNNLVYNDPMNDWAEAPAPSPTPTPFLP